MPLSGYLILVVFVHFCVGLFYPDGIHLSLMRNRNPLEARDIFEWAFTGFALLCIVMFTRVKWGQTMATHHRYSPTSLGITSLQSGRIASITLSTLTIVATAYAFSIEHVYGDLDGRLWFGFGTPVMVIGASTWAALMFLARTSIFVRATRKLFSIRAIRRAGAVFMIGASAPYALSLVQLPNSVIDKYHFWYLANDALVLSASHTPYVDYFSQYSSLLAVPVLLASVIFGNSDPAHVALWIINVAALTTVIVLVFIVRYLLPTAMKWAAVLLTVPIVLVKGTPTDVTTGSLVAHPAALASRGLFVTLASIAVLHYSNGRRRHLFVGIVAGLALFNSIEFGLPIVLGVLAIHLSDFRLATIRKSSARLLGYLGIVIATFVVALFVMCIGPILDGENVRAPTFGAVSSQFAAGFGAVAQPGFGLHVIILGMFLSCVAIGDRTKRSFALDCVATRANMLVFIGVAGYFSFPYFVNRSIYSGQLQYFLLFLPIVVAALIGTYWGNFLTLARRRSLMEYLFSAPALALLLACFVVSSVVQMPSWRGELARLGYGEELQPAGLQENFTSQPREVIATVTGQLAPLTWRQVSHVLQWGNYVETVTGSRSKSISSDPENYWLLTEFGFPTLRDQQCSAIAGTVEPLVFEKFLWDDGTPMCPGFRVLRELTPTIFLVEAHP